MRWLKGIAAVVALLVVVLLVTVRLRYGGGKPYPDLTTPPILADDALEIVAEYREPIGNVAVSAEGRVFFTAHPEARPEGPRLLEWVDGAARAYPDAGHQDSRFQTPLGIAIDRLGRLWTVDPADHGSGTPRLLAFDLATGSLVFDHRFSDAVAPLGSFLQDLQVAPDGATVYIADVSFWRKCPALIVVDVATGQARRVLERDPSVMPQDWIITIGTKRMVFFGGLAALKPGVDGIAISTDGEWLSYGAMTHDRLFRIPTAALRDRSEDGPALAARIEDLGPKPLSDGLSADIAGGVWITDVEHGAVMRRTPDGRLETWLRTPRIRWADALSWGPDGWLYLADSAIPDQMLRSREHIAAAAPYFIYRFRPAGITGIPGQ